MNLVVKTEYPMGLGNCKHGTEKRQSGFMVPVLVEKLFCIREHVKLYSEGNPPGWKIKLSIKMHPRLL